MKIKNVNLMQLEEHFWESFYLLSLSLFNSETVFEDMVENGVWGLRSGDF